MPPHQSWTPMQIRLPHFLKSILAGGLLLQYVLVNLVHLPSAEGFAQVYPEGKDLISIEATAEPLNLLIPKIAKLSHLNVLMDESVMGQATLKLDHISGLNALKVLARMHGLTVQSYGKNIWMISSQAMGQELGLFHYNSKTIA